MFIHCLESFGRVVLIALQKQEESLLIVEVVVVDDSLFDNVFMKLMKFLYFELVMLNLSIVIEAYSF